MQEQGQPQFKIVIEGEIGVEPDYLELVEKIRDLIKEANATSLFPIIGMTESRTRSFL